MLDFFGAHFIEDLGRVGIGVAEAVSVIGVDAGIFFFEGDGERQDLALREVAEFLGHEERIKQLSVVSGQLSTVEKTKANRGWARMTRIKTGLNVKTKAN